MNEVIIKDLVFIDQELQTQNDVLEFIATKLYEIGRCSCVEDVIQGFYSRESEFSTAMNDGIAIPHCLNQTISDATVIVVRNKYNVLWTNGEDEVNLFFSLLIPKKNENQIHIRILAKVAQLIMEDDFIKIVREATDIQTIYDKMSALNKTIE